jgi:seryl-tRNA synthetase
MDNDKILEYLREDFKNMETRVSDRITKVEGKIECLRKDIVQVYQNIFELQKEVQMISEKVKSHELDKEQLKILKVKVDNISKTIDELKDKCNSVEEKDDVSVKKITTICTTISSSLAIIASIITNQIGQ